MTVSPTLPTASEIKRICAEFLAGRANGTIPPVSRGTFAATYEHCRRLAAPELARREAIRVQVAATHAVLDNLPDDAPPAQCEAV